MKIRKILTLSFLLLALVAIVNHQLTQNSKRCEHVADPGRSGTRDANPNPNRNQPQHLHQ